MLAGIIGGFLGLGGGILIVPSMMMLGFGMKYAVGISVMQMMGSSIVGTVLNLKAQMKFLRTGVLLSVGGMIGGVGSGYMLSTVPVAILEYTFLGFVAVSIVSILKNPSLKTHMTSNEHSPVMLIVVGTLVGMIAMSLGIGGGLLLIPFLTLYLGYDLKTSASLMLFFLMGSSVSAFVSIAQSGYVLYQEALLVSVGAIGGVMIGSWMKKRINLTYYKYITLIVYCITFCVSFYKIILQ